MSKCSSCGKDLDEVGSLEYINEKAFCEPCKKKIFDIRLSAQYYRKLFVKCPFCDCEMEIKEYTKIEKCSKCNIKITEPGFCGFCEDSYKFIKKQELIK